MRTVVVRSFLFAFLSAAVFYAVRFFLHTDTYLSDVSGLSAFVTVFGTLFGIMAAFVVFEVWSQYNKTQDLIEQEAQGLERLFRLTLYFRDDKLTRIMEKAVKSYASIVIEGRFSHLGSGRRNVEAGRVFRKIAAIIREVKFDDDHDQTVYDHVLAHYGHLSEVRALRINQSLARLPVLLKLFLYISSLFALATFVFMPFANQFYGFMATGFLGFVLAMVFQLVEDLDNPFSGHWNITPEPFERALKHIEGDY